MGFSLEVFAECEAGIGLVVLLLILGCYVQSVEVRMHPVLNAVWMCISFVALPIVMVHVIEYLSGHEIALLPSIQFALNVFWCQLVYAMLFALTNHYRLHRVFPGGRSEPFCAALSGLSVSAFRHSGGRHRSGCGRQLYHCHKL